jgi:hypothetical protein
LQNQVAPQGLQNGDADKPRDDRTYAEACGINKSWTYNRIIASNKRMYTDAVSLALYHAGDADVRPVDIDIA